MTTYLIRWTADTLHGKQWGEFEHVDATKGDARAYFWQNLSDMTGLDLRTTAEVWVGIQVVGTASNPADGAELTAQAEEVSTIS